MMTQERIQPMQRFQQMYRNDRHLWRLILMIVIWLLFMAITRFNKFYSVINFQTMAAQFPEFGIMSLGVMLCMITGGIDLSVVGTANLTSILMGFLLLRLTDAAGGLPAFAIPLVFLLGILIGGSLGLFNGLLVSKIHIPPHSRHYGIWGVVYWYLPGNDEWKCCKQVFSYIRQNHQ